MRPLLPAPIKLVLAINCAALLGFIALLVVEPQFTDLGVRMNYTQLDRAGVINQAALDQFHPDYGFTESNQRNAVPRYIAGSALQAQKRNALLGGCLAVMNVLSIVMWAVTTRRAKLTEVVGT